MYSDKVKALTEFIQDLESKEDIELIASMLSDAFRLLLLRKEEVEKLEENLYIGNRLKFLRQVSSIDEEEDFLQQVAEVADNRLRYIASKEEAVAEENSEQEEVKDAESGDA